MTFHTRPAPRRLTSAAVASTLRTMLVAGLAALAACADPGTGPRNAIPRAAGAPAPDKAPPAVGNCTASPVQAVRVTTSTLALTVGQSATVTACTQYFSTYAVRSDNPAVATVAPSGTVTPTQPAPDAPYAAPLTITAVGAGTANITVTDKKGNVATVAVTVTAPPPAGITFTPSGTVTVTYASSSAVAAVGVREAGYTGAFTFTTCSATASTTCSASGLTASCTKTTGSGSAGSVSIVALTLDNGYPGGPVIQVSAFNPVGTFSPPSCTATVGDTNGNTATLTINPAA
ncbi:hypothetical protein tb265_04850 [Gemmatimonadetes bacterium T265]|nr:hypothetical protein tb265_04850 [Gemmatimonadetes bacterium T265]